ncbi:MAG: DUF192 domain-containing protein [Deltaproteobacteria bacterium]|nr:DUF192 domain-containing protein [Deltaproteobacteria bacterium]
MMLRGGMLSLRTLVVAGLMVGLGCVGSTRVATGTPPSQPPPSEAQAVAMSPSLSRTVVVVHTPKGDERFDAEIADTPADRARGLMERWSLAERAGMLFVFPREQHLTFWMKNTLIPLDMIFIGKDRTIVGIVKKAQPLDTDLRSVRGLSQFVLELAGGAADAHGLEPGQTVSFDATIPAR